MAAKPKKPYEMDDSERKGIIEIVEGMLVNAQARSSLRTNTLLVVLLIVAGVVLGHSSGVSTTKAEWAVAVATEARDEARAEANRMARKEEVTQMYLAKLIALMDAHGMDPPEPPEELMK